MLYLCDMKHEQYIERIKLLREELSNDIKTELLKNGADEVNLNQGILHQFVDDQFSEVISTIKSNGAVVVDTGMDGYTMKFSELSTDQLICVLEAVEKNEFEIIEEVEE